MPGGCRKNSGNGRGPERRQGGATEWGSWGCLSVGQGARRRGGAAAWSCSELGAGREVGR